MPASVPFPDALPTDLQTAMAQWRVTHLTATLAEIEQAVDQQLSAHRAALIATTATAGQGDERPACPACGQAMHRAGERTIQVTTAHEGEVALTGQTYRCPACGTGLSPLVERLALVPGRLSPALAALAVQFGLECSFGRAAHLLTAACGTHVSHDTIRRLTERAGASWWQLELDLVTRLEIQALTPHAPPVVVPDHHLPPPDRALQVSIDGALVPLVGGEWAEVRTLVVGEVSATGSGPKAMSLSYVSQLATAAAFSRTVLADVTRRGVATHPRPVVAISDGAVWIQDLLDLHCPQAIRVLDIVHAAGYLAQAAQATFGSGTEAASEWIAVWRHALRQGQTFPVLAALAALPPSPARTDALRYLSARIAMLDYPRCDAEGWPVGSGAVESANKAVVETRLKGSGMHWTREHANAMVGLRAMVASGRWATTWPRIVAAMRAGQPHRAMVRRAERALPPVPVDHAPPPIPLPDPSPPVSRPKQVINGKPTPDHPWRRSLHGRTPHPPGSS